jgi:hypothetical protein
VEARNDQERLKLNGMHEVLIYAEDLMYWGRNISTIKKNPEALLAAIGRVV